MNIVKPELIQLLGGGSYTVLFFFLQEIYFQLTLLNILQMFMLNSSLDVKNTYIAHTRARSCVLPVH